MDWIFDFLFGFDLFLFDSFFFRPDLYRHFQVWVVDFVTDRPAQLNRWNSNGYRFCVEWWIRRLDSTGFYGSYFSSVVVQVSLSCWYYFSFYQQQTLSVVGRWQQPNLLDIIKCTIVYVSYRCHAIYSSQVLSVGKVNFDGLVCFAGPSCQIRWWRIEFPFLGLLLLGGKVWQKHVVDDIVELRTDQCVELACLFDHFGLEMGHPVESTSVRIDLNGWRNLEDDGPGIMQILGLAHCDYSILFLRLLIQSYWMWR